MPVENSYTPQNFIVSFKKKKNKSFQSSYLYFTKLWIDIDLLQTHIPATEKKIPWIVTREIQ